ncbi:MAG: glycoside hydrolase family 15 protein [Nitrospirota bacterium]|nr:glycoside hydrolase family 15 protein [Nitrospirota bacterium]
MDIDKVGSVKNSGLFVEPFGGPGLPSNWSSARKQGVGTALSSRSRVWFTIGEGVLGEVYFPSVDTPVQRDLQILVSDGKTFVHEDRRDFTHSVEWVEDGVPAFRIASTDPTCRYRLIKTICTDPRRNALLMDFRLEPFPVMKEKLFLYLLWAPQIGNLGADNQGVTRNLRDGKTVLWAWRGSCHAVMTATVPFLTMSAGYVGFSDGWQDLMKRRRMEWSFPQVGPGHIALTAEINTSQTLSFTVSLGFAKSYRQALRTAEGSLGRPFYETLEEYRKGWISYQSRLVDLSDVSGDGGVLFRRSVAILKTHFDKQEKGAAVASLSIPWGEETNADKPVGGYHLVWPRDLVHVALGLLAAGDRQTPVHVLRYLFSRQNPDGSWHQNFWVDGAPFWSGLQLDQVAFPVILAHRLIETNRLPFDPYPSVKVAADFLIAHGPRTPQDRWEENSGLSPGTLAAVISALYCASELAEKRGEKTQGETYRRVAQSWDAKIESWTYTDCSQLLPDHPEHYERIALLSPENIRGRLDECRISVPLHNQPSGGPKEVSQCCLVDSSFLELVRRGIRDPQDPRIIKTLSVYDALCQRETRCGTVWLRYNGDGYGESDDGSPFAGTGRGRPWPLLSGERGHYELASGRDPFPAIRTMECCAGHTGLLPEQVWDGKELPEKGLSNGAGTGSATPLAWAHAEYLLLLRSRRDGVVFDRNFFVKDREF